MRLNRKILIPSVLIILLIGTALILFYPQEMRSHKEVDQIMSMRRRGHDALSGMRLTEAYVIGDSLLKLKITDPSRKIEARILGLNMKGQSIVFAPEYTEDALEYFTEAEALCLKSENYYMLAAVYNGFGNYYLRIRKNSSLALLHFFKGLNAAKIGNNDKSFGTLLTNISMIYFDKEDPRGLRYALECYNTNKKLNNERLLLQGCLYTGFFYALRGELELAKNMAEEAEHLLDKNGFLNNTQIPMIYGELKRRLGDNSMAEKNLSQALTNSEGIAPEIFTKASICYSKLLKDKGDIKGALAILKNAELALDKLNEYHLYVKLLSELSSTSEKIGNKALAKEYEDKLHEVENSLSTEEAKDEFRSLKSRYDFELAEKAIVNAELKAERTHKKLIILIAIIILILIVTICLYTQYRKKSKLYAAIVKQSGKSAMTEKTLRETIHNLEQKLEHQQEELTLSASSIEEEASAQTQPPVSNDKYLEIKMRLESLMTNPEIYTDNNINKDKVSKMIGTNRTYLSHVINTSYGITFTKFINGMRIKEAIRRMSDVSNDVPIKQLASDLGFNSLTTFYSQFIAETGMTPAKYREQTLDLKEKRSQESDFEQ